MDIKKKSNVLAKDIQVDQIFGQLRAIATIKVKSRQRILCKCACGRTEHFLADPLRTGRRVRCSDCHDVWIHDKSSLKVDRTGEKFGKLVAIERLDPTKPHSTHRYRCRCECGNEVIVRYTALLNGTKSCGCLRRGLQLKKRFATPQDSAWKNIWHTYKKSAKVRKIEFQLSLENLKSICASNCHYCGCPPSTTYWQKGAMLSGERVRLSTMNVNGIDRLDNNLGYIPGNMVAACKTCNYAKFTLSECEFYTWLNRICRYAISIGKINKDGLGDL